MINRIFNNLSIFRNTLFLSLTIVGLIRWSAGQANVPTAVPMPILLSTEVPSPTTIVDQAVESSVNQLFTQTAQAQQQIGATQTVNAALNQALTSTAEFQSTVNVEFARRLRMTDAANLTQTQDILGIRFHLPANWVARTKSGNFYVPEYLFGPDANVNDSVDKARKMSDVQLKPGQISFWIWENTTINISFTKTPDVKNLASPTSTPFGAVELSMVRLRYMEPGFQLLTPTPISTGIFKGVESVVTIANTPFQALVQILKWQGSPSVVLIVFIAPGELAADRPLIDAILSHAENISPTPTITKTPTVTPTPTIATTLLATSAPTIALATALGTMTVTTAAVSQYVATDPGSDISVELSNATAAPTQSVISGTPGVGGFDSPGVRGTMPATEIADALPVKLVLPATLPDLLKQFPELAPYINSNKTLAEMDFSDLNKKMVLVYNSKGATGLATFLKDSGLLSKFNLPESYLDLLILFDKGGLPTVQKAAKDRGLINSKNEIVASLSLTNTDALPQVITDLNNLGVTTYPPLSSIGQLQIGIPLDVLSQYQTAGPLIQYLTTIAHVNNVESVYPPITWALSQTADGVGKEAD